MTRYARSGHYRTNQYGTTHWVNDHSVSRDDWPAGVPQPVTGPYRAHDASSTTRNITIPNARCPVCKDPVFFFMAANGGRVFFDRLGKPWPKHGCLDTSQTSVPAFDDAGSIVRWQMERRREIGPDPTQADLCVTPGYVRGFARIVHRQGRAIAVVEASDITFACEVEGAWPDRSSKTVYFQSVPEPGLPATLEYLSPDLDVVAVRVLARVDVPCEPSLDDLAYVAESLIPDVDAWVRAKLPVFRRGHKIKLGGRIVGLSGWVGRSRALVMPVAVCFDGDEDDWAFDDDIVKSAQRLVSEWTGRVIRMLNRSEKTRKDPLYRDLFVWLVPGSVWSYELERLGKSLTHDGKRSRMGINLVWPSPAHVMQSMDNEVEYGIREECLDFRNLVTGESEYIAAGAKAQTEKRWLAAVIRDAGLEPIFARLGRDGVEFRFVGTTIQTPYQWGQQAILPDGRSLLVLLHLSTPGKGLAFVYFGAPSGGKYGSNGHSVEAIFHAKRLTTVLRFLEAGSVEPSV